MLLNHCKRFCGQHSQARSYFPHILFLNVIHINFNWFVTEPIDFTAGEEARLAKRKEEKEGVTKRSQGSGYWLCAFLEWETGTHPSTSSGSSLPEITKRLGAEWSRLAPHDKQVFFLCVNWLSRCFLLKEFHPIMKICWKCTHPQAIQDVDEFFFFFIRTDLEKCIIACSSMDPLQWMGAVRMRVQTAEKKHHNNPHNASPSFNILWNMSLLSITLLSTVKRLSRLNQRRNMHRSSTIYKQKQF